ncbi:hypothetical protein DFH08DRAFT_1041736 [Mycena albidolilacea]|uniref:Arrestin-like N-terminal domain-containing protein n=1 Tax=Mycena albidolilacea TaxID=1033008 RepID=A0AAD6ZAD9_9AGAR|nr:hypothetical protein DFH08DRAFT_1041736 [Mycena albidolilacea]
MNDLQVAGGVSSLPPPYVPDSESGVWHRFPLQDKRGKQWGVLAFQSGARKTTSIPLFYEDDTIHGSFETDVNKGDSMRSVTVKVEGSVITGTMADDRVRFLKLSTCLWSHKTAPLPIGCGFWSFSLPLPNEVTVTTSGQPSTFRMPESFLERHTRVTVLYEISVAVSRAMFRSDSNFKTRFRYVPCTRPDPPSALRQRAYRLNRPLLGPTDDRQGWETSAPALARGHAFRTRDAVVRCTLSLPRPLCYTRGSVIPCWLTLTSGDVEALELYAPDALSVHLHRCVCWQSASTPVQHTVGGKTSVTAVARAVWWQRVDDMYTRTMEGELRVPADLVSSSAMGTFSISYTVELGPPDSVGFAPVDRDDGTSLISMPVEVVTMYATDASRPIAYAPPSYENFTPQNVAGPSEGVVYTHPGGVNMGRA